MSNNTAKQISDPPPKNNKPELKTDEFSDYAFEQAGKAARRALTVPQSIRQIATKRIAQFLAGESIQGPIERMVVANTAVNIVMGILSEPDDHMADVGAKELALGMSPKPAISVQRELARVVFRAMLSEARR